MKRKHYLENLNARIKARGGMNKVSGPYKTWFSKEVIVWK